MDSRMHTQIVLFLSLSALILFLPHPTLAGPTKKIHPAVLFPKPLLMAPSPFLSILCGAKTDFVDSRGNLWKGDAKKGNPVYYSPGTDILATSASIARVQANMQALYQTERSGIDFTYKLPVGRPGAYYLVLYFSEIFFLQQGMRRFNVQVNNRLLITNLDIADQVGSYTALSFRVPLFSPSDFINVRFTARVDRAKIAAIAVYKGTFPKSPPSGPSPNYPVGRPFFAVAAGRLTDFKDPTGVVWRGDASKKTTVSFSGGGPASTIETIANTKPGLGPIYQTERSGAMLSYVIRVPKPGKYVMELFFCEFYFTKAGERVFNIYIQGKLVLSRFDIVKATNSTLRGISYKFPVTVVGRGDTVLLRLIGIVSSAKISAFSISPASPGRALPTVHARKPKSKGGRKLLEDATGRHLQEAKLPRNAAVRSFPPPYRTPSMNKPIPKSPPPSLPKPKVPRPHRYIPTAVTMWRYKPDNTGHWPNEYRLNTANVRTNFGFLFNIKVDSAVYAQPLYVPNVPTKNGSQNILYVATENNSVYGINADTGAIIWYNNFHKPGVRVVSQADVGYCGDIAQYGITSTPAIDLATWTIFVVANTNENGAIVYRLHGLDLTTGAEKPGSPTAPITATMYGHTFDGRAQLQRPGLVIDNDIVYLAFGSHCDHFPLIYHGWIFGYNIKTYQQVKGFITTPGGVNATKGALLTGAIWMSGASPAVSNGFMYVSTGNGYFDGVSNWGETILKLNLRAPGYVIPVADWFTPSQFAAYNGGDIEVGSGGITLIANTLNSETVVQIGKPAIAWILKAAKMGKYLKCQPRNENCLNQDANAYQAFKMPNYGTSGIIGLAPCLATPAYYAAPNSTNGYLYIHNGAILYQFVVNNGRVRNPPRVATAPHRAFSMGATPIVTGTPNGRPVLWEIGEQGGQVIRAFDAVTMNLLFDSSTVKGQPDLNFHVPFSVPLVVNGRLYAGAATTSLTTGYVNVFGLKT